MANSNSRKTFPVKPKLKSYSKNSTPSAESKYWKSFKSPSENPTQPLISSISSISFSPISPHDFVATHSATATLFSSKTLQPKSTITSPFKDTATSASFRSDGLLLAAADLSGLIHIIDVKTRNSLRRLRGHARAVHVVKYPKIDKLHVFSGGDDSVVKYWDVATESSIYDLLGHKDYVRCGDVSPVSDDVFVSGSYDHLVKVWDVRVRSSGNVMEIDHEKPVESVVYLPSGGLVATAGWNVVKIWDLIGGGRLLHTMESHNKTVTSLCVGKIDKKESGDEWGENRILSVALDGYMKVFDYGKMKITHSMRFPSPLMSIGFSPDCSTRVIGASNGMLYVGKRKVKQSETEEVGVVGGLWPSVEREERGLRPSYFRYFHRGQSEKPAGGDYAVLRSKKVKVAEHDKLLKKFMHKEALMAVLAGTNPANVVAVMEELVARKKLFKCVSMLETEELGLLLGFIQKHSTIPRYAAFLMGLAKKVIEMRSEDIKSSDELKGCVRNMKRDVEEELRIQHSLQEIQGIISPLLKIAARR